MADKNNHGFVKAAKNLIINIDTGRALIVNPAGKTQFGFTQYSELPGQPVLPDINNLKIVCVACKPDRAQYLAARDLFNNCLEQRLTELKFTDNYFNNRKQGASEFLTQALTGYSVTECRDILFGDCWVKQRLSQLFSQDLLNCFTRSYQIFIDNYLQQWQGELDELDILLSKAAREARKELNYKPRRFEIYCVNTFS